MAQGAVYGGTALYGAIDDYEIFEAAAANDVRKVKELLDCGIDINLKSHDRANTPLHVAAAHGQKGTMEILVARGCDINATDDRKSTALHSLIHKRYDVQALWLARQGADIHKEDRRGFSPHDLALDWFQKELEDAAAGVIPEKEEVTHSVS